MKARIISVILAVLLIGLVALPGCVSSSEYNELKVQLAEKELQIAEQQAKIAELETRIETKDARIAEQEEKIAKLETEIERLSPPEIPAEEIVGTVTFEELRQLARKFFPKSGISVGSFTRGPYPLVSVETLKEFLVEDSTNIRPACRVSEHNPCDDRAFRLKDHWIRAGFPPHSLSLIKGEKINSPKGGVYWRNLFITRENGELVLYEVEANTDEITKIEKPQLKTYYIGAIQDRL